MELASLLVSNAWMFIWAFGILMIAAGAIKLIAKHVRKQCYIVYNYKGGYVAVCTADQYRRAWTHATIPFSVVREAKRFSRTSKYSAVLVTLQQQKLARFLGNLFVPLVSNRHMSQEAQKDHFANPDFPDDESCQDPSAWAGEMLREMREASWLRRFAFSPYPGFLSGVLEGVGLVMLALLVVAYVSHSSQDKARVETQFHYFSNGERAVPIAVTDEMLPKLPMRDMEEQYRQVQRGIVFRVMPIGGGLDYGCLSQVDGRHVCGFASRELDWRLGTLAFLRPGRASQNGLVQGSEWLWWGINEKEADALERVGFKVTH